MRKSNPYRRRVEVTEEWYGQPPPAESDARAPLGDVEDMNAEETLDHDLDGDDLDDDSDDED